VAHSLGYFDDEEDEAVMAYNSAARQHHGEKAKLNSPLERAMQSSSRNSSRRRSILALQCLSVVSYIYNLKGKGRPRSEQDYPLAKRSNNTHTKAHGHKPVSQRTANTTTDIYNRVKQQGGSPGSFTSPLPLLASFRNNHPCS
jgi:hypothetical protein